MRTNTVPMPVVIDRMAPAPPVPAVPPSKPPQEQKDFVGQLVPGTEIPMSALDGGTKPSLVFLIVPLCCNFDFCLQ